MIRLADAEGPALQICCVADEVNPVTAAPVVSDVPVVWAVESAHSTEYGTLELLPASVKALPEPLPVAVIE